MMMMICNWDRFYYILYFGKLVFDLKKIIIIIISLWMIGVLINCINVIKEIWLVIFFW